MTTDKKGDTISSSEFIKSLRGVGKRYPVRGNDNGKYYGNHFQLDTSFDIENVPAKELQKCSGTGYVVVGGKSVHVELHWYQAGEIRIDTKIKPPKKK